MEYVRCVCVWLVAAWMERGRVDWVWALPILCLCFGCDSVGGVGGQWVGGLDQGLEG